MDGTREFTRRIPEFAVSIALALNGEPVVGVVHNPIQQITVSARRDGGAFRNGEPCRISSCASLARARVVASRSEDERGMLDPYRDWFGELAPMGSIAWKLALIASGEADFNLSLKPKNEWDVCAGDLLVREAGGQYVDFSGAPLRYNLRDPLREEPMIAGPPDLLEEFIRRQAELRS
jgi:myo-inositol-1(or 4)-monophosphatase